MKSRILFRNALWYKMTVMARMNVLVIYAQLQFCFAKDVRVLIICTWCVLIICTWRVLIIYTWQSQLLVLCDEVPTACIISQLCGSNDNAILQRTVTKTKRTSWLNIYGVARRFYLDSVTWLWLVLFQIRTSFIALFRKSRFCMFFNSCFKM